MLTFTDTHTHLYDPVYGTGDEAVERAVAAGVTRMVLASAELPQIDAMLALASRHPQHTFPTIGLHPTELTQDPKSALAHIAELLRDKAHRFVAVGETGIDLYCEGPERRDVQQQGFETQCLMALEHDLPVIIHCRDGLDETLEVLRGLPRLPQAVFHCFGGTPADVERIRNVGDFYFGIGGVVTFKNSKLRFTLPEITLDRILLETDAPWLAPTPHRGTTNESAYIPLIAETVADNLPQTTLADVSAVTQASASAFFKI